MDELIRVECGRHTDESNIQVLQGMLFIADAALKDMRESLIEGRLCSAVWNIGMNETLCLCDVIVLIFDKMETISP